ncbi:MAG: hypothetical protein L3I99_01725 [Sulfurimonas sp.]|nr:hypothetical protein [Sulfurimonas sp.]
MHSIYLSLIIAFALLFSGCSSKKVFEPEHTIGDWKNTGEIEHEIIDTNLDGALLNNRKIFTDGKVVDIEINDANRFISKSDDWIISVSIDGNLTLSYISDSEMIETFDLKKTIATASVKDDVLAVLFADNEMALYSISTKELLLKESGSAPIAVNSKIVKPYFMNDLVLFLTLDGKVVIVNVEQKKKLRSIIVSSEENFNNIIYFNVIDDKLIAITGSKILSFAPKEIRVDYEIRDATYDNQNIFIATKQGEIISLTPDLQINAKVKFSFAHFLGLISHNDKLYALEKEGYLIELSKDLLKYDIYEVDVDDGYIYIHEKTFYINDEFISVE